MSEISVQVLPMCIDRTMRAADDACMHVLFSWRFDGLSSEPPVTRMGEVAVGPSGLLALLEADLGLPPVLLHSAEQLVAYRSCLEAADNTQRFYHASFKVDPINVAATLKSWRERWYDAGWDGQAPPHAEQRIRDMADVEAVADGVMPLCGGQRARRIEAAMLQGRTQIERITLSEPLAYLPAVWRSLLTRYECVEPEPQEALPTADNDLGRVQDALMNGVKHEMSSDASFLVMRAASRDLSATHIAELLHGEDPMACLLVAEQDGIIVDNALQRAGLPRVGFQHYSKFRAISQVLKLSLGLMWRPLDPQHVLQFLLHPDAPLSPRVRRALAEAVSREPGIGGSAWQEQVAYLCDGLDEPAERRLMALLQSWFFEARYEAADGAQIDALIGRVALVARWLAQRLSEDVGEAELYAAALAQAEALRRTLQRLANDGVAKLNRIELEHLVDEAASDQPDPALRAQANHVRATTHPGNVRGAWQQVVWWDPAVSHGEQRDPWSEAEIRSLGELGVELPSLEARLQRQAAAWLQPVLAAQQRFVLVVHDSERVQHPLWVRLQSLVKGWREVRLETNLLAGAPAGEVGLEPVVVKPLPEAKRWWHLPDQSIAPRPVESYSSLHNLYYAPHQWVLRYSAALRPGRAEDLTDGPRLYGNIAHRVFERFFTNHADDWREMDPARWLEAQLADLMEQEAAILLQPGRGVDRQRMVKTLEGALDRLVVHLKAANVSEVACEVGAEGELVVGQKLQGTIDLLLRTDDGRVLIIDAKYGGERYRGEELAEGEHLQLATYAQLISQGNDSWPDVAYFIISTGNLLATSREAFPTATVFAPMDDTTMPVLWQRAQATFRWRRGQLDEGWIEANSPLAEITERSEAPADALKTQSKGSDFDDFVYLLGWEPLA